VDKPAGWAERYADAFRRDSVADEYHRRPPYPEATFDLLESLVDPAAPAVLDAGCGTGELGRRLVRRGLRVDAVDRSEAMVEHGRAMARGADPGLRWIVGNVETADLDPSYGLVVCGDSIHWFDWQVALPRICDLLSPRAFLAVVQRTWLHDEELLKRLSEVYARHGTNRDFRPRDAVVELANRGYFEPVGERTVPRDRWRPTLTELTTPSPASRATRWPIRTPSTARCPRPCSVSSSRTPTGASTSSWTPRSSGDGARADLSRASGRPPTASIAASRRRPARGRR
jgi:SAM-dependent methyltransferase